jgi:hypothetical protein
MADGPTVNQLRWAATGTVTAVGPLAIMRGWLPPSAWSLAFVALCMSITLPKLSARVWMALRAVAFGLFLVIYVKSGALQDEPLGYSTAIVAMCLVPILIDVLRYQDRAKKSDS